MPESPPAEREAPSPDRGPANDPSGPPWRVSDAPLAAGQFRRARDRSRWRWNAVGATAVALVVVGAGAYFASAPGSSASGTANAPLPLGAVTIDFGPPVVATTVCGDGNSETTIGIPWVGSNVPLTTSDLVLQLQELRDGDVDGGPIAAPSVTSGSVCAGRVLTSAWQVWYAVLQYPDGSNVAWYTYSQDWVGVGGSSADLPVQAGSTFVLVTYPSVAGLPYGLCLSGTLGGPTISTCADT